MIFTTIRGDNCEFYSGEAIGVKRWSGTSEIMHLAHTSLTIGPEYPPTHRPFCKTNL